MFTKTRAISCVSIQKLYSGYRWYFQYKKWLNEKFSEVKHQTFFVVIIFNINEIIAADL